MLFWFFNEDDDDDYVAGFELSLMDYALISLLELEVEDVVVVKLDPWNS